MAHPLSPRQPSLHAQELLSSAQHGSSEHLRSRAPPTAPALTLAPLQAPRTATLFLIDCSSSMGRERVFTVGDKPNQVTTRRSGLDAAKEYVKAKLVQRVSGAAALLTLHSRRLSEADSVLSCSQIMRDLRTTPFGVILFGHAKTKNLLTTRAKELASANDEKFDRSQDPYRHCYELLPLTKTVDMSLVDRIDDAVAGEGPDTDAFSAAILGLETLDADATLKNYAVKEVCLLTDGEHYINWDGARSAASQMNAVNIGLTVMCVPSPRRHSLSRRQAELTLHLSRNSGVDFDDEEIGFVEENKSEIKVRTRRSHLCTSLSLSH